ACLFRFLKKKQIQNCLFKRIMNNRSTNGDKQQRSGASATYCITESRANEEGCTTLVLFKPQNLFTVLKEQAQETNKKKSSSPSNVSPAYTSPSNGNNGNNINNKNVGHTQRTRRATVRRSSDNVTSNHRSSLDEDTVCKQAPRSVVDATKGKTT